LTRIGETFSRLRTAREGALVAFLTAGDPSPELTPDLIRTIAEAGADVVEVGIPYSDPLADGPVIQASSQRALDRGVTPPSVLAMVRAARALTGAPIVLMTSYNLVLQYGLATFASDAKEAGADGAILTDLPPEEAAPWKQAAQAAAFDTIFLVAPTSTPERIALIAREATGFVYCVSRTGVTGARRELPTDLATLLDETRRHTDQPLCVGFGISTPEHVAQVCAFADGAVIGSALVSLLHEKAADPRLMAVVAETVAGWKAATRRHDDNRCTASNSSPR
jgi:tryptophan synthase alpha chain